MKIDYVKVDRTEYEALKELRDTAHETLIRKHEALAANYKSLLDVDNGRVHFANKQELTVLGLREKNLEQHKLILQMQRRLQDLEPMLMQTASPAFKAAK